MDGVVPNWFIIKPDQLAFLNPLVCMLFIPMLELFIYPALAKIGIRRPLQYITVGAALCALSYVMAAYVEVKLEVGKNCRDYSLNLNIRVKSNCS